MSTERLFSLRNPWFIGAVGSVVSIAILAALIGFIWLPYTQERRTIGGLWDAICRAAGAPAAPESSRQAKPAKFRASEVVIFPQMLQADSVSIDRGAALAPRCTTCHSTQGTTGGNFPVLAGQSADAIYKQLRDFQTQHRKSEIMAAFVAGLSDRDMRDLAAYFASLPRPTPPPTLVEQLKSPAIVQVGAPMRNIAPCGSCHGGSDHKVATPFLDGEPASYLRDQLRAFAAGSRRNDIFAQMRNIARHMTPEEIELAADYYSRR
jgi:cytochrome c553